MRIHLDHFQGIPDDIDLRYKFFFELGRANGVRLDVLERIVLFIHKLPAKGPAGSHNSFDGQQQPEYNGFQVVFAEFVP